MKVYISLRVIIYVKMQDTCITCVCLARVADASLPNLSLSLPYIQTMAGLERLIPYIYHEKQQEGSMLCAQHALNSLLRTSCKFVHPSLAYSYFYRGPLCTFLDHFNIGSSTDSVYQSSMLLIYQRWRIGLIYWRNHMTIAT